jgi:hypothetical protein
MSPEGPQTTSSKGSHAEDNCYLLHLIDNKVGIAGQIHHNTQARTCSSQRTISHNVSCRRQNE